MRISNLLVVYIASGLLFLLLAGAGIRYGLPHEHHLLSYDPDETTWVEAISRINPREHRFNPHPEFAHPTLYLGLYAGTLGVLNKLGWIPSQSKEWFRQNPTEFAKIYLAGRFLQIPFALLMLVSIGAIAHRYAGPMASGIAVFLLSITPSVIGASHFSQANLPVTSLSFLAFGLLFLVEQGCVSNPKATLRAAAVITGLAISTKYSAVPLVLPLAWGCWRKGENRLTELPILMGLTAGGFFIGSPFALLAPASYWAGFSHHTGKVLEPLPMSIGMKLIHPLRYPLRHGMGTVMEVFAIGALAWQLGSARRSIALLLYVASLYAGTMAAGYVASPERVLPLTVVLVFVASLAAAAVWQKHRMGGVVCVGILGVSLILPSAALAALHYREPVQITISRWIEENLPAGSTVGLIRPVYWWTPAVLYEAAEHPERLEHPYRVQMLNFSVDETERLKPRYILLSGAERTNEATRSKNGQDLLVWLDSGLHYRRIYTIPRRVSFGPWTWNRPEHWNSADDDLWSPSYEVFERLEPRTKENT